MTKPRSNAVAAAIALAFAASGDAWGEPATGGPWLSELRVGVFAHDQMPLVHNEETGADFNVELLARSPRGLRRIGAPRPHVGATLSTAGGTSLAYAGLTWEHDFRSRWFLIGGLGLAVHDADPLNESDQTPEEAGSNKALGCRVELHWGVGPGYRISPRWNVALHYEHLSNGWICGSNEGLENIGARMGWLF